MATIQQGGLRNRLLRALPPADFQIVAAFLRGVELPRRMVLERPGMDVDHCYFIEAGLCSVVVIGSGEQKTETGHIGWEGMSGLSVIMGVRQAANETLMQVAGIGWRIASSDLVRCMEQSANIRKLLLVFAQTFVIQISHTLLATARYTIQQRLARWLLMCHDRTDGDDLALTHEFLSLMLAVRRSGVTEELHVLEGFGVIKATRGVIQVVDRAGLTRIASGSYGIPEREYETLFSEAAADAALKGV